MKPILAITALALAGSLAAAGAQTTTTTTTSTTVQKPDTAAIQQYVTTQKTTSVTAPSGFTPSVGAPLPEPVPLYKLPDGVSPPGYQYTVVDGHTVVVDENRNIVDILD